jgi:hypothetical protein
MDICALDRYVGFSASLFLIVLACYAILPDRPISHYVQRTVVMLGSIVAWNITGRLGSNMQLRLKSIGASSFFVYAAHEPLLGIVYKMVMRTGLPHVGATILILYFALPICLILLLLFVHRLLRTACPIFVGILTGDLQRDRKSQQTRRLVSA